MKETAVYSCLNFFLRSTLPWHIDLNLELLAIFPALFVHDDELCRSQRLAAAICAKAAVADLMMKSLDQQVLGNICMETRLISLVVGDLFRHSLVYGSVRFVIFRALLLGCTQIINC